MCFFNLYLLCIFWPLYCLFFDWRLLITSYVSFGHCIVCPSIDGFWLPLRYLLAIVLSVLRLTASDYLVCIFWPLYCLFFDWRLLITSYVSFGHCIVCSSIDGFWLPLWYLMAIVLSVLRLTLLITSSVSFGHCIVCSSIDGFWLPLMYLLAIVLSVLRLTASDYLLCIFWSLYCLFFDWRLLITSYVSFGHCIVCSSIDGFWLPLRYLLAIVLSVLRLTASDYLFGIIWPLYCLFFDWRLLITSYVSFGHCIVCSSIDGFWLPLWYLLAIVLSVLRLTASDYLFGIFWSLYCLFLDWRLLITSLVSFGHCIVCSSIDGFWLPLMYLLVIVLSVLRLTASNYLFGIFWPLYCLFFDWRLLITSLVSFGHCIVCSSIDGFWLPLMYLLVIVLSVLRLTASDYLFGIFWSLYCLFFDWRLLITSLVSFGHCIVCSSIDGFDYLVCIFWSLYCLFFDWRLLITSLVSFGHCIVCSSIDGFWLPLWYLLVIVLSVLRLTASDYLFGIF